MVILDATTLILLIEPSARPPKDPATGKPLEKCKERVEYLLQTLSGANVRVLVPTPVLAEVLVRAGSAKNQYLQEFTTNAAFKPAPFDERAAVELSMILDGVVKARRALTKVETWAKVKFDRQIVAIAKVHAVKMIYTDDEGLAKCAKANGIETKHTWELPLPPVEAQQELGLEGGGPTE